MSPDVIPWRHVHRCGPEWALGAGGTPAGEHPRGAQGPQAHDCQFEPDAAGVGRWVAQGLRMKDAGEDLLHVSVVPRGHFPPSL